MTRVSVIVISKDEPSLAVTLDELESQCADVGAECIVVDASKGRLDALRDRHPWVRWSSYVGPEDREITIPHQRNAAMALAKGEVFAFCDSGGVPHAGWLERLTAPIIEGRASATGGPIRSIRRSSYGTLNDLDSGVPVRRVVTCNFALSRALLSRIGGFDERFDYGSDTEFGWRINEAGDEVVSVADAVVDIDWGDRRRQLKRDLRYGEAKARQFRLCPRQRRRVLHDSPEVIVYPLLFFTAPFGALAALLTRTWIVAAPWVLGLVLIMGRDLWCRRPPSAMVDHVVVSIGICRELARATLAHL